MTVLDYRSAPAAEPDAARTSGHWLGWAVYLAMSWTWCIGMYLPVLLVRDYGFWAWVAFAVPNVVGAAAMGWVLRQRESSAAMVAAHRPATIAFSFATVAFQFFFAAWMFYRQPLDVLLPGTAVLAAVLLVPSRTARQQWRFEVFVATVVLILSVACATAILWGPRPVLPLSFGADWVSLGALAPVMVFGFLLCPYLDLTFHRARQMTSSGDARVAFSIGFGVLFLAMITFTLSYRDAWRFGLGGEVVRWALSVYFMLQLAFTSGVHVREVGARVRGGHWTALLVLVLAAVVGVASLWLGDRVWPPRVPNVLPAAEMVYRTYMGLFGLLAPAYVWLCVVGSARRTPSRRSLVTFVVAALVAAPAFWLGFIEGRMLWLLPGLSVVLLARLAVGRNTSG